MNPRSGILRRIIQASISITGAYFIAFVALGLVGASLGPTLPGLAAQTQTQLNQISFLFTARSLGYLLGSFLGGRLYDHFSGHPLMGGALFLMAACMAFIPAIPILWALTLVLLFLGVGEGMLDVGGNTLLVWIHGRKVGPVMNGMHFFFGVGAFLSPILVAQMVLASGSIGPAYWLIALVLLPAGFWLLQLPSPSPITAAENSPKKPLDFRLILLVVAFFSLYVGAEVSFGGWIFTYASQTGVAGETAAAYLTSVFWAAFTLGRLVSIPVAARIPARTILFFDLVGALVSLTLMLIWPGNRLVLWAGSIGFGISIASIFPTTLSLAGSRIRISGQVTGYFFLGATAGGMSLPWIIGQFFERSGPHTMLWILLADLSLATIVFGGIVLASRRKNIITPAQAPPSPLNPR